MEIQFFDYWPCFFYVMGNLADCIWTREKDKRLVLWRSTAKSLVFTIGFLLAIYAAPTFAFSILILLVTIGALMLLSTSTAEGLFRQFLRS